LLACTPPFHVRHPDDVDKQADLAWIAWAIWDTAGAVKSMGLRGRIRATLGREKPGIRKQESGVRAGPGQRRPGPLGPAESGLRTRPQLPT